MSVISDLADLGEALDHWDDETRSAVITLFPLRGRLRDRGFLAVSKNRDGQIIVERVFMLTDEGLRALTVHESRRLVLADRPWRRLWRQLVSVFTLSIVSAVVLVACRVDSANPSGPAASTPTPFFIGRCEVLVPRMLPSGAAPGAPTPAGEARLSWGSGSDRVVEAVGVFGVGDPTQFGVPQTSRQWVSVRGSPGIVVPVGEESRGEIAVTWQTADCPYTVWLTPGHNLEDGIRYAADF